MAAMAERGAVAGLAASALLAALGTSSANVALPRLAEAFGVGFGAVQWVVLAYLLAVTATVAIAGRLGDGLGRRRVLLAGLALFGLASLAAGLAPTLGALIAARAVQALGAAAMMALAMASLGDAVPKAQIGRAMGLLGTMSALGTAAGPLLGGALLGAAGWPAIFWMNAPLAGLAFWLVARHLPQDRPAVQEGFDLGGALLLALALASLASGLTPGRPGATRLALLLAGVAGVVLFLRVEARAAAPLIRPALLRDVALRARLGTSALIAAVMMATLVVGPFHLGAALGLEAAMIGGVMAVGPAMVGLGGVPAGRLVDRIGAGRATAAGLGAMLGGCAGLALAPPALGLAGYVAPLVLLTAGYALAQTANNSAVMTGVGAERRGSVSGLLNLARNLGLVSGAAVLGTVFALGAGTDIAHAGAERVAAGTRLAFGAAAGLVLAGLVIQRRGDRPV